MKTFSLLPIIVLLAACGGDKHDAPAPVAATPEPPAATLDPFVASVTTVVAGSSDTAEPQEIDTATTTAPENSEPVAVNP